MARTLAAIRKTLGITRPASEAREELRTFERQHGRDSRGFVDEAHARVEVFSAAAREQLAAAVDPVLSDASGLLLMDHPLRQAIVELAMLASPEFATILHERIDAGTVDAHGRPWASITRFEFDGKVAELERELRAIDVAGRAEAADQAAAEAARLRDEALAAVEAEEMTAA